jgi:hypothetical protein
MFFISGDFDGNNGNALWFSGSGAARGGCFLGKGFPRRRWLANIKIGTGRFAKLVAIIMVRESRLLFIWRMRKGLVFGKRIIGIYKSFIFWFGGGLLVFIFYRAFSIYRFRVFGFQSGSGCYC